MANDRELWGRICRGDASAFDGFYRENAPRLRAFLRQLLGNRQAAEDVMQETFTLIWQCPNGFQPERGPLRTYLYGIGRKRAADWWRKQGSADTSPEQDPAASGTETVSLLSDAMARLPQEQRTLLWLREVEGQSYSELAAILEIPLGTVRSRLFAAREQLRKIWQGIGQSHKMGLPLRLSVSSMVLASIFFSETLVVPGSPL
jgi:RNA polymerase sigma-70 factor (ECF subfamily)